MAETYSEEVLLPIELDEQVRQLADWAATKHSDQAEFHHFPHSWGVYEVSMWLADRFEAEGQSVDRRVLAFAAITHDLHAHLPISTQVVTSHDFESKEHRSAFIAVNHLIGVGYDEETLARPVHDLIITTRNGEVCASTEAIILRIADIFNTCDDFEVFEERAQAFYRETCKFEQKTCSFVEWLPGAMNYLEGFVDENLPQWFREKSLANIKAIKAKYLVAA